MEPKILDIKNPLFVDQISMSAFSLSPIISPRRVTTFSPDDFCKCSHKWMQLVQLNWMPLCSHFHQSENISNTEIVLASNFVLALYYMASHDSMSWCPDAHILSVGAHSHFTANSLPFAYPVTCQTFAHFGSRSGDQGGTAANFLNALDEKFSSNDFAQMFQFECCLLFILSQNLRGPS